MINNKNNTTVSTSEAEIASQSEIPEFISALLWDSYCSIFIFLCSNLEIVVCSFVSFRLAIVLSVFLRFTASEYPILQMSLIALVTTN